MDVSCAKVWGHRTHDVVDEAFNLVDGLLGCKVTLQLTRSVTFCQQTTFTVRDSCLTSGSGERHPLFADTLEIHQR